MRYNDTVYKQVLGRVRKFMEEEEPYLDSDFMLKDLAEMCLSNRTYVSQALRDCGEESFRTFLNRNRVARAKRLLRQRTPSGDFEFTVADVAEICGFATERSFYRVIKRFCGTTPNRLRRDIDF